MPRWVTEERHLGQNETTTHRGGGSGPDLRYRESGCATALSPQLFLDWDDVRQMLSQQGIDFRFGYVSETATNCYKVGGWYSSATAPDVVDHTAAQPLIIDGGEPLMHHGQYGAYFNFQQRLTAPDGAASARGLSFFVDAAYADRRTSTLDNQVSIGVLDTGPIGARRWSVCRTRPVTARYPCRPRNGPRRCFTTFMWRRGWICARTFSMSRSREAWLAGVAM